MVNISTRAERQEVHSNIPDTAHKHRNASTKPALLEGSCSRSWFQVQEVCNKQGFQATPPLLLSSPSPEPLICSLSQESVFVAGRGNVLEKNNPTKHLFITHLTLKSRSDPGSPFLCGCTTVAPQCASGWCSHILLPLIPAFGTQVTPVPHIPNHQLFQW